MTDTPLYHRVIEGIAYSAAVLFTFLLNTLVLYIMFRRRRIDLKKSNIFITNLAVCHEIVSLLVMPFVLATLFDGPGWSKVRGLCVVSSTRHNHTSVSYYSLQLDFKRLVIDFLLVFFLKAHVLTNPNQHES